MIDEKSQIPSPEPVELATPMQKILDQVPSPIHRNASWGAIISVVVILVMVIVGALYSWGQRVSLQSETTQSSQ